MNIPDYDVWVQPWIPVTFIGGGQESLGLGDVLRRSHEIGQIAEPAPTMRYGLYRLLVALVSDICRFDGLSDLRSALNARTFDHRQLNIYREENAHRFRLFDPHWPFLQTATDAALAKNVKPVAELLQHLPSGTFSTHFRHGLAENECWSAAVCARALAAVAPFMTAGGAGYSPSINGAPPWYVLIRGESLKQTLLLNSIAGVEDLGEPAWRQTQRILQREERLRYPLLDALTWQPRTIQLIPGAPGHCTYSGESVEVTVSKMVFTFGLKVGAPEAWRDPAVPYRRAESGRMSLKPREGKQAWRDFSAFALARENHPSVLRPLVVGQLEKLLRMGFSPSPEAIECFGIRTDNMKVFEWRHESLTVPSGLLTHRAAEQAANLVEELVEIAEEHARLLRHATKKAYPREGSGNRLALDRLIERSASVYWDRIQTQFWTCLGLVAEHEPSQANDSKLREAWREKVGQIGAQVLDFSLDQLGRSGDSLRRSSAARRYYRGTLKKLAG